MLYVKQFSISIDFVLDVETHNTLDCMDRNGA